MIDVMIQKQWGKGEGRRVFFFGVLLSVFNFLGLFGFTRCESGA
jgi:hypothetical protein